MHLSVHDFVVFALPATVVEGARIIEVGAMDINGSVRPCLTNLGPAEYIGTDRRRGRRVDVVCAAERLLDRFAADSFDIVICTETLEHIHNWRAALFTMCQLLREGGILVLTTRSPGFPRHEHPDDHWRFTADEFRILFRWWSGTTVEDDPVEPGVFVRAIKTRNLPMPLLSYVKAHPAPLLAEYQRG